MGTLRTFLWGKKTYLIAAAMVVVTGLHALGYISDDTMKLLDGLLFGGGLATLRAGVAKRTLILVPLLALTLTGCTNALASMSPEQLTAMAKMKDASVTCVRAVYAGAVVTMLFVSADKGVPSNMTITDDCKTTIDTKPSPKP